MKTWKTLDFVLQTAVLFGSAVYYLVAPDFEALATGYFLVGGCQVVSMVGHYATGNVYPKTARLYYHWVSLVAVLSMFVVVGFWILLFLAPVMAVFYWSLCLVETSRAWAKPQRIFA